MLCRVDAAIDALAGEPHAAETVVRHRHPKQDDYFERALMEVFKKNRLPLPDVISPTRFRVPDDRMDFACDRVSLRKDDAGTVRALPPGGHAPPRPH